MKIKQILLIIFIIYILHYFRIYLEFNYFNWSISAVLPLNFYKDLSKSEQLKKELLKVGGVYSIYHLKDGKQYIGSSFNLYERLNDHLKGVSSNIRLQRSIAKSGITNFIFIIYYFHEDPLVILTDVET